MSPSKVTRSFSVSLVVDGENSIHVDLDNEHEDFLYNDAGTRIAPVGGATSQARLFDGIAEQTTGVVWYVSCDGGNTFTRNSNNFTTGAVAKAKISSGGLLTVDEIYQDTAKVVVRATYNNGYYYATFTANKNRQDKYDLVLSENSIAYNPEYYTSQTQKTILIYATRTDLQGNTSGVSISFQVPGTYELWATYDANDTHGRTEHWVVAFNYTLEKLYLIVTPTIASLNTDIYFELRKYNNTRSSYTVLDYETVPINKAVNGEAAWLADLDNEMDAVSCDDTGYPIAEQTVSTTIALFHGVTEETFFIAPQGGVYRNGSQMLWNSGTSKWTDTGVEVTLDDATGVLSVKYGTTAKINNGKDEYTITVQNTDNDISRDLHFIVNGIKGDVYNLKPGKSEIVATRNSSNTFNTTGIVCGYTRKEISGSLTTVDDVSDTHTGEPDPLPLYIDGKYNIWFRRHLRSTNDWELYTYQGVTSYAWHAYNYADYRTLVVSSFDPNTYDAVEFVLCTEAGNFRSMPDLRGVIDRETVHVVADGGNGRNGKSVDHVEKYFKANSSPTTAPAWDASTWKQNPTDSGVGWSATNEYLWCREKTVYDDSSSSWGDRYLHSVWGEKGNNGAYDVTEYGLSNEATTSSPITAPTLISGSSWTSTVQVRQIGTYVWMRISKYNGTSSTPSPVTYARLTGDTGGPGAVGKWYYYAGVYDGTPSHYQMQKTQAPYVIHGEYSNGKPMFWMLDFKGVEPSSYPAAAQTDPSSASISSWTLMSSEQEYYIAKAFFGDYAQFGSFIINGDWMISTQGTKDGEYSDDYPSHDPVCQIDGYNILFEHEEITYNYKNLSAFSLLANVAYTFRISVSSTSIRSTYRFNDSSQPGVQYALETVTFESGDTTLSRTFTYTPSEDGSFFFKADKSGDDEIYATIEVSRASNFVPNFSIDGKTGRTYQQNAYVNGTIVSKLMYTPTISIEASSTSSYSQTFNLITNPSYVSSTFHLRIPNYQAFLILPSAIIYDGLEICFFHPLLSGETQGAFALKYNTSNSNLYAKNSGGDYVGVGTGSYVIQKNKLIRVKAIGNNWFVID